MRRRSSNQSSPSLAIPSLHPTLQGALESLDIDLEEELARYRRQRHVARYAKTYAQRRPDPTSDPMANAALGAIGAGIALPTVSRSVEPKSAESPSPSVRPTPPPPPPRRNVANSELSESSQLTLAQAATTVSSATALQPHSSQLAPVLPEAAEALANPDEYDQPDDYLASSEELLRGMVEEEKALRTEREPALLDTLLTPLGIGSMLLLLLSSVTLGYIIMNPSSLSFLNLDVMSNNQPVTPEAQNDNAAVSTQNLNGSGIPNSPNLANEEFVDLDLDTLGTLPTDRPSPANSAPAPTSQPSATNPAVSPAAMQPPTAATQADLPTVPVPRSVSSPRISSARTPAPPVVESAPPMRSARPAAESAPPVRSAPSRPAARPAPAQPAPVQAARPAPPPAPSPSVAAASTTPAPSSAAPATPTPPEDYYYVVTEYSGDRSLDEVREAVPDAYVRNFSNRARVQSGAFSSETAAEELVEDLAEQGISAEIYRPE
jgi:hypothetical protein